MKHISRQELSDLMGYKNINSFNNSKTNKDLLINLVNTIEDRLEKHYANIIEAERIKHQLELMKVREIIDAAFRKQGIFI
jgi:predicted kinase